MILNATLGTLALLSCALNLWQWWVARRFPLHRRVSQISQTPGISILKPLKGCDAFTEECLRSWLTQNHAGRMQILFAVGDAADPVCVIVKKLLAEFPAADAQLHIFSERLGANAKVSLLARLEPLAKHEFLVLSDADVFAPPDLLTNLVATINPGASSSEPIALANCFYRLSNPETLAMRCEAVAINADFWSQVLQSQSLAPLDFGLGAAMILHKAQLQEIGGLRTLVNHLADDYQLGNRIAKTGRRIALCPVVVECRESPGGWKKIWRHQLRWARTIRVCKPVPYFFSILNNATLWPLLWASAALWFGADAAASSNNGLNFFSSTPNILVTSLALILIRIGVAFYLQKRLTCTWPAISGLWAVPLKDVMQFALWISAFAGNRIEWRGQWLRLKRDGTLSVE